MIVLIKDTVTQSLKPVFTPPPSLKLYQHTSLCFATAKLQICTYSKTCVKRPLSKRAKIGFQDQLLLNAGQKRSKVLQNYCRILPSEHSALLLTFMKLPLVMKIFVLSIFEWLFYTGFTVLLCLKWKSCQI